MSGALPLAVELLLPAPFLDNGGGTLALVLTHSVAAALARSFTAFALLAAPRIVCLGALLAITSFLIVTVFVEGVVLREISGHDLVVLICVKKL